MIKIENWKMAHAHNRHLLVTWKGKFLCKVYTHRYWPAGQESKTCGWGFAFQWAGFRKHGVTFGGDAEYCLSKKRKAIRFA